MEVSFVVSLPLCLLTILAFQSVSLSLQRLVLCSFTFWLYFSMIPSSCFSLLHFVSGFHIGMWENLILWKGTNKSLQVSNCLWKYFLNIHTVIDISDIICGWIHECNGTVKCFLHRASYLQRNKQTEKNYF